MRRTHFEYIVIGGGSGGYAAARTARETLEHVAIVDGSEILGGLCILKGCMPCLLYTSPSPRDGLLSRMPSSA